MANELSAEQWPGTPAPQEQWPGTPVQQAQPPGYDVLKASGDAKHIESSFDLKPNGMSPASAATLKEHGIATPDDAKPENDPHQAVREHVVNTVWQDIAAAVGDAWKNATDLISTGKSPAFDEDATREYLRKIGREPSGVFGRILPMPSPMSEEQIEAEIKLLRGRAVRAEVMNLPLNLGGSGLMGLYRNEVSRPLSELTGAPQEVIEGAAMIGGAIFGMRELPERPSIRPGEPPPPPAVRLEVGSHEAEGLPKPKGVDDRVYNITRDGEKIGVANVRVEGDTADIRDIYTISGETTQRGQLGFAATRQLLEQFREENPEVTKITGERVSGARFGGEKVPFGEGQPIALDLNEAKRLRAIGDESPPPVNEPPAEAAKRAMAADAKPDEKITLDTQDAWMERVKHTVSKIDKPDDARRIILDQIPNIDVDAIRSGELPVRDVQELASAAGLKPGELDPATMSRKFRNDDTVRGVITAALQATDEVKAAASAVDLAPTPENLIKMQQAIDRHALLVEQWFGHRAEWGRTGNVFQEFMTEAGEARSINDMLKDRGTNPTDLKLFARAIKDMDREGAARILNDKRTYGFADKLFYYWVNGLISGIITHAGYIQTNAVYAAMEHMLVTPFSAAIGKVKQLAGVQAERQFFGEGIATPWGMVMGVPDMVTGTFQSIKTGQRIPIQSEIELFDRRVAQRDAMVARGEEVPKELDQEIRKHDKLINTLKMERPISGVWGRAVGAPGDVAGGIHTAFKLTVERGMRHAEAYRATINEGGKEPLVMRLYRGETAGGAAAQPGSGMAGGWYTTDLNKAQLYGKVSFLDVTREDMKHFVQGHGGPDEWVTDNKKFRDQSQPLTSSTQPFAPGPAKGLNPTDSGFTQRYAYHLANPTDAALERVTAGAYKGTYMQDLGTRGKAWQRFVHDTPGLRWLFPFNHIPLNIIKNTAEYVPGLNLADTTTRDALLGKKGGIEQDRAIARMVVGSSVMGYFAYKAMNGQVTGDYPEDPKEKAEWALLHKQPHSVLVNGQWVSLDRKGPAGNLAKLGATIGLYAQHIKTAQDQADFTAATANASLSAARIVADEVGFQSVRDAIELFEDPHRRASIAAYRASSFIPLSSMVAQTASYMDPDMRRANTFLDSIKYRLPGLRQTLPVKMDWSGQPVPNPGYQNINRAVPANTDPLDLALVAAGVHPGMPHRVINGVKLNDQQYEQYVSIGGQLARQTLEKYVTRPEWTNAPVAARAEVLRDIIKTAHESAAATIQIQHKELIQQGVEQRRALLTAPGTPKLAGSGEGSGPPSAIGEFFKNIAKGVSGMLPATPPPEPTFTGGGRRG